MSGNIYKFQKLTPVSDINLKVYEDAIDYVFDNPDVRNVAISGAYSAGKSSVLASYKKKHEKLRFMHISLAHFKSFNQEDGGVKESILEGKILNQLIHQIPSSRIPQTNFRVKKKVNPKNIILNTVGIILFTITILHVMFFYAWNVYISSLDDGRLKLLLKHSASKYSLLISGLIIAIIVGIIIYNLVKVQKNKNVFRKISLQGNEIEIFEESDDSYFDKYLNEVLYLFENADSDVIIFEDMDRFNVNRIFERLREVNTLVNIQFEKDNKMPLRFFYLLRDDIFMSRDRTKFFDYIIPVVPVLDSSNSYDQFILHLKNGEILDKFDESFLQGLSLYIDDMRLLKNIYNEFVIYYNRLNIIELDCNRMLAMIVYKNLFPRDFSELQLNQGFVFSLFDKKDEFIRYEINILKDKVKEKENELDLAQNEHLLYINELDIVYDSKREVNYWGKQPLSERLQAEYSKRKQAIENKESNMIVGLEGEIIHLKEEVLIIQNKSLKEIITRNNIDSIFKITTTNEVGIKNSFNDIKSSEYFDLLKYLIRNGYIDETYSDYMTYFYENSLSRIDKTFMRSITDKKAKEYTYKLKNPKLVVRRLRPVDFDQEEILNFDLLQYLLNSSEYIGFLKRFICQLKDTKNYKFVAAYLNTQKETAAYVNNLNIQWPEMLSTSIRERRLSEKQIRLYSINSIYYSDNDTLKKINIEDCLTDYISNSTDYLDISNPNIEELIRGFSTLNVFFKEIDYDKSNKELFSEVYKNSLYKINFENLTLILNKIYGVESIDDIRHRNYTLILSNPDSALRVYINKNIDLYVKMMISNCNGRICDDLDIVLLVLNNEKVTVENKKLYIEVLKTSIIEITDVKEKALIDDILEKCVAVYSKENIIAYYKERGLNDILISFINRDLEKLDFTEISSSYEDEIVEKFFDDCVICDDLVNIKYKEILISLGFTYEVFEIKDISNEKFDILVEEKIVKMSLENLKFVRENYSECIMNFIRKNIMKYVNILTEESFVLDELIEILLWGIKDEIKIQLLKLTDDTISIIDKSYSNIINEHILQNNLDEKDIPKLFSDYKNYDFSIQSIIYELSIKYVTRIIDNPKNVSNELINQIFVSKDLDNDRKIDLFIGLLSILNKEQVKEYFGLLGLSNYLKLFEPRSRPKFKINSTNEKILTALKNSNWIYDFEADSKRTEYYKITRIKYPRNLLSNELL
ncbi:hypothetical protein CBO05C_2259 [Clostridium botulinum B str. Osaka05]|uniref:YobI-like P-loop NTPase domain-containing protein n=1 Tax=Clostridium botulinum B str. Osaka05 TaxID=1407017 RepID=A0A0S6U545_CLOBO|nr:hypothetical protein [Clostridium botulinum]GAE02569.1 hypothetical protein CBO05C_2259 [Clostridium botulinum B str. Osaka05]